MSNISKRKRDNMRVKIKGMADHKEFLKRINKTLYYGQLPLLPCLSLPVTEVSCNVWSECQRGRSVRRLRAEEAARVARGSCVSPCTLVLALLYLERLHACNPDYLNDTEPSDLFLVSLMVGSKFLEDNGEDDEVLVSEWAESSGLDEDHVKQLEIEFLKAIDWNVYVNKKSFEAGLLWLEKQVALKQGQQRGFYTYTDLVVAYDNAVLGEVLSALTVSWLTLTLGYITSLMTLVTSTLVVSQAWLPALQHMAPTRSLHLNTNIITSNSLEITNDLVNTTLEEIFKSDIVLEGYYLGDEIKCCTKWLQYQDYYETPKMNWPDSLIRMKDRVSFETWWSTTSIHNWLYQSSLINPVQRWLQKLNEISEFVKSNVVNVQENPRSIVKCNHLRQEPVGQEHCVRQWLNLSKLSALVVSVSDR